MIGDFLKQLVEIIKFFRFIRMVRVNENAVRMTNGTISKALPPGWYWCIPGVQRIEIETILLDSVEVRPKSITTRDDIPVTIEIVVWFKIVDVNKHWTTINEHKANLAQITAGHLNEKVRRRTWESVRRGQGKLEAALRVFCAEKTSGWGTQVTDVRITQLTKARPYRIIGTISENQTAKAEA